jgi:hypothetical protein
LALRPENEANTVPNFSNQIPRALRGSNNERNAGGGTQRSDTAQRVTQGVVRGAHGKEIS